MHKLAAHTETWSEPTAGRRARVLVVDDEQPFREAICRTLRTEGYEAVEAAEAKQALDMLAAHQPIDLVLLDLKLDHSTLSGMGVLRDVVKDHPLIPVVMISGNSTVVEVAEATQLGAYDFLAKGIPRNRILLTVRNALEKVRLKRDHDRLLEEVSEPYSMVGSSAAMQEIRQLVAQAGQSACKVIITGESGVGKELVAHNIHLRSDRAKCSFIAINVAAIHKELVESTLFGSERGAYTGARKSHKGKFEQADGGTLFLDEIGDMSLGAQAKILRTLDAGEVDRLGSERIRTVDVRLIAATNKNLEAAVAAGTFREDLYYRLNVFQIHVPPLRDRSEDIPELIEHLTARYWTDKSRPRKHFAVEAQATMAERDWPGNIRELRNAIEQLMVKVDGDTIQADHVARYIHTKPILPGNGETSGHPVSPPMPIIFTSLDEARENFERRYIVQALIAHEWKIQETATALGVDRATLYRQMLKHKISNPSSKRGGSSEADANGDDHPA